MRKLILLVLMIFVSSLCYGGSSRSFDGANDEISGGDVLNVTTGNVSLCAYVNLTEDASTDFIAGKADILTSDGYELFQTAGDLVSFRVSDGTDEVSSVSTTDTDGAWFMACGTWNATTETTAVYINGTQEDTDVGANVDSLSVTENFKLGEDDNDTNDALGSMAYVMQFSKVLTDVELQEIRWHPDYIVESIGLLFTLWGDSPETNIGTRAFTGALLGTTAVSTSGPPIMIGDAPI